MTTTTSVRPAIEATGLRKAYREHVVLDGVDLRVPEATVFALLGPNGAGKPTTVQILSTLIPPNGGSVRVCGHDLATEPDRVRAAIGVTGQFSAVDNLVPAQPDPAARRPPPARRPDRWTSTAPARPGTHACALRCPKIPQRQRHLLRRPPRPMSRPQLP